MKTHEQIEKDKKKQKILKKYLSSNNQHKKYQNKQTKRTNFLIKDSDQSNSDSQIQDSKSYSDSEQNVQTKRRRVASSDEQKDDNQKLKKRILQTKLQNQKSQNQSIFKNKKLLKKFKTAFGIHDPQQLQDFLKQIKIQGMDMKEIKKLLKSKKVQIKIQQNLNPEKAKKEKKKKKKQQKKQKKNKLKQQKQPKLKFQAMISQSGSSDLEIPQQARTIYRNKDGTIKMQTENQIKQKRKKQVYDRLAEWQKGMKAEDSDKQDNQDLAFAKNSVWDDPLKIWNQQNIIKPFQCKYAGPANRFNIKPGYRWDGVVRGNGFQNRLIQQENLRKAKQARQHKQYLKNL